MMKNNIKRNNVKWQKRLILPTIIIFALIAIGTEFGLAQEQKVDPKFRWEFSIGGISYYVSKVNYWNFGPELIIQYALKKNWGVYGSISYPYKRMTNRGYGFREGFPFDIGAFLSTGKTNLVMNFGLGISYIWGSDSDGSYLGDFGGHVSGHLSFWITNHFGAFARATLRLWLGERYGDGAASPSISAGLSFRF